MAHSDDQLRPLSNRFVAGLADGFRLFAVPHALALTALVLALFAERASGAKLDFRLIGDFATYLGISVFLIVIIKRFVELAFIERSAHPTRDMVASMKALATDHHANALSLHVFALFMVFSASFGVIKTSIAALHPFSWDLAFIEIDRVIHFGHLPHEWLAPLVQSPGIVFGFNIAYNFWFVMLVITIMHAVMARGNLALRIRYLTAFMLTWLIAGNGLALVFSSAGPCYVERLGLGDTYAGLMAALHEASRHHSIFALTTQDLLWQGYTGERAGGVGISAFPSMHVATAVLIALWAGKVSRLFSAFAWLFALAIQLGSVVLAWHYAVDGYAGALLALGFWWLSGRLLPVHLRLADRSQA